MDFRHWSQAILVIQAHDDTAMANRTVQVWELNDQRNQRWNMLKPQALSSNVTDLLPPRESRNEFDIMTIVIITSACIGGGLVLGLLFLLPGKLKRRREGKKVCNRN